MDDRRYRFDPTSARAAGRLGAVLVAGLAVAVGGLALVVDEAVADPADLRLAAGAGLAGALLAWWVPWHRLGRWSPVVLPLAALAGLVALEQSTGLRAAPESVALHLTAWIALLAWVGITQPRGATLVAAPFVVAAAAAVVVPDDSVVPVAAAAVALPAGVVLGEATAWALAGIRRGQRIQRRRELDIRALAGSVGVLRSHRTGLEEAADLLARLAHEVFHGEHVTVVLSGREGQLVPVSLGEAGGAPSRETEELVAQAVEDREVRLIAENGTTLLIIPLIGETEIGGAVVVRQPRTGDDPFTQQLAVLFANQAGPALEQLRVIGQLSEDLRRDELTGVGNLRHARALVSSLAAGDAVVYIDLDHFSQTNETYGHEGANRILREFSDSLRQSVRDSDLTARVGGDEFILVARAAELDALRTAQRLLESWRASGPARSFTAGVAIHDGNDLPEQTLENADRAMFRAKRLGRNQICLFQPGGWSDDDPGDAPAGEVGTYLDFRPGRRRTDTAAPTTPVSAEG